MQRSRRAVALAATLAVVVAISSACSLLPCIERRHQSGLLFVCPEPMSYWVNMPEELKGAASFGLWLAEEHPDDLGYPWPNAATGELEARVTSEAGEAAVREWIAGRARRTGLKEHDIPRPLVPVKMIRVDRSYRSLTDIQHDAIPGTRFPDGDAIYMTGPDQRRNAVVIVVDRVTDDLMKALASRYGTSAIVIRSEAPRPQFRELSRPLHRDSYRSSTEAIAPPR